MLDQASKQLLNAEAEKAGVIFGDNDWVQVPTNKYIRFGQLQDGTPIVLQHHLGRTTVFIFELRNQLSLKNWTTEDAVHN